MEPAKKQVQDFWDAASCGEDLYLNAPTVDGYSTQAAERYRLEPYIADLANFEASRGKRVLEVGVGLGADHQRFAESGAILSGIDLTPRAIEHAKRRFALLGLKSDLRVADAEHLPFEDGCFDVVYSYGVIHHTPKPEAAVREIHRVLAPDGELRVMIYHRYSLVGLMLKLRYGIWKPLDEIFANYLESPGTKAYSRKQAIDLFSRFHIDFCRVVLTHGDLLESGAGQRHGGVALNIARKVWPRWLFKRFAKNFGHFMLITGIKR